MASTEAQVQRFERPVVRNMPARAARQDPGLTEIVAVVGRRWKLLLSIIGASMLLAFVFLTFATPEYSAETLIMIEPKNTSIVSIEEVVSGLSGDEETVQSEVFVLASRALAGRVIRRLELYYDPEFNPEGTLIEGTPIDPNAAADSSRNLSAVIDRFLDRLTVLPKDNSRVISARFSSASAEKAATILNVLSDEYILSRLEGKFSSAERANEWLGMRIAELRDNVQKIETDVEAARERLGLLGSDGVPLVSRELVELNTQLVVARSERAEAEARLAQIEDLSPGTENNESLNEVLDSALIQRLREQESEVERRVAELSSEYGELHPRMIKLKAEAEDLNARIEDEIARIVSGLKNRVDVVKARERSLEQSLDEMKRQVAVVNQNEIELRALEREAEASRNLLVAMLARQKETVTQNDSNYQQADVRVISPADIPAKPSFPQTGLILGLALVASTILGMVVILVIELLDSGFRNGEEIEEAIGVPSIGFVPLVQADDSIPSLPQYVFDKPNTAFAESIRTLNWSIGLAFPAPSPKSVLITSSIPGEGKTTIATCLATSQAMAGRKTILIDADTRRPNCHTLLKKFRVPGLVDVLTGKVPLKNALFECADTGLFLLPAGVPSNNSANLLDSAAMRELFNELTEQFEFIVVDSPPTLATTDARILCQLTDATVAVVQWAHTRRAVLRNTIDQLVGARARLAGVLLTMVDAKRHAKYSYGDSGAYTGDLEKYYIG